MTSVFSSSKLFKFILSFPLSITRCLSRFRFCPLVFTVPFLFYPFSIHPSLTHSVHFLIPLFVPSSFPVSLPRRFSSQSSLSLIPASSLSPSRSELPFISHWNGLIMFCIKLMRIYCLRHEGSCECIVVWVW